MRLRILASHGGVGEFVAISDRVDMRGRFHVRAGHSIIVNIIVITPSGVLGSESVLRVSSMEDLDVMDLLCCTRRVVVDEHSHHSPIRGSRALGSRVPPLNAGY